MKSIDHITLAESTETGTTGIYHLKRIWSKALAGQDITNNYPDEAILDNALIDILGIGLLPAYEFLYGQKPDFESFENWVIAHANGHINAETIKLCNALFEKKTINQQNNAADVLTAEDLAFWDEQGYVILKQAITQQECAISRKAILDYLDMDEQDEKSWYGDSNNMQGIMVTLYRNAAIDKNRYSPKIRRAFEQIWNRTDLIVTTDKCGFNPPETSTYTYRGTGLHWDVSLATPIPFGTQGILYLTDTVANQGALTVVPGFHKKLETWLKELPGNIHPREVDLSTSGTKPIAANAGDFIIWNHKLPHGSSPNKASLPRIVQYINWYAPLAELPKDWV
ncbi:MAG: phytanoyl-CoA dioxygenase family protein [Chitinophagaceae bacterium]|nr:phytanoyl-CoA dioxygenase family protein [Chitinophagaceae bacterium]